MNGKIESIEPKETKAGKAYKKAKINGKWVSFFKPTDYGQLKEGIEIEFNQTESNGYVNGDSVVLVANVPQPQGKTETPNTIDKPAFEGSFQACLIKRMERIIELQERTIELLGLMSKK